MRAKKRKENADEEIEQKIAKEAKKKR